ncbi:protein ALTERED PHOSPHATE STARVATION RESPONSE 1-like [Phragmites australis]|uniref:protein ALTERED PHOSPHATE STARVATION RESPONSE 1-like n=1 Tax=Phragmites australis TaxID=29695 RepID=UPI002D78AC14|nr:protein ALTERED PHOSPHATE STARVATION RESPONSE 1-like [Phragmites australis]
MGCGQSKIDQEEAVCRCRDRKRLMADAVQARNAFAAAHTGYTVRLKSTGGALSDFAHGEAPDPSLLASYSHHAAAAAAAAASVSAPPDPSTASVLSAASPPPPPPFSDFSHSSLQRSSSTPNIPMPDPRADAKNRPPTGAAIREEDEDEEEDDGHIRTDSDDDDDDDDSDDEDDHHEHDDVSVDGMVHGRLQKRVVIDSVGSSPVTPPPPPRLNPAPPTPASATPPPPVPESQMATWDYIFGPIPTPPLTLEQPPDETWMERHEKEIVAEVKAPVTKPVVSEPAAAEERPPHTAAEKQKTVEEMVANLAPSKPIVRKPPKAPGPLPAVHYQHASSMGIVETRKGKMMAASGTASLLQIVTQLDDNFLRASESAHDVSKKLEATRMHYHSNHADSRGHIDHSTKIMHVITWNRSFKNLPDHDDLNDNFEIDERFETHAAVLDRMLAWEKKLYDEVKAGELMKIDYQKKVALLHKQKKRGVKLETLEKTKAAVSHLHTRYIVDMQSMDSTVSEINQLRDKQLYPKLVDLVDGMAKMWSAMHRHHRSQFMIVIGVRGFEVPPVPRETTDSHYNQTCELRDIVREWHVQFEKLMDNQKAYIRALNAWLKLNLIPIESNMKEKVSSPPRQVDPPIKHLLYAWHDHLERLPIELAKTAIKSFAEVISNIVHLQEEEVSLRRRCEETRRDLNRKKGQFEDWHQKYLERRAALGEDANPEAAETQNRDPIEERKRAIEEVEIRLREEEGAHHRLSRQVREKSLANLRTHLPELFRNMADFAFFCHDMYNNLRKTATMPKDEVQG